MVTAELAVGISSLVVVLVLGLSALSLGATHVTLVDAARIGARSAARGDPPARVIDTARSVAPGSTVEVSVAGAVAIVTVRGRAPAVLRAIGVGDPSATARTPTEAATMTEEE